MSPLPPIVISLAYVVPLAVIGMLLAAGRPQPRWLLGIVLAALPLFYTGHYLVLQSLPGWPSDASPPDTFELVGFSVIEPANDAQGEILVWLRTDETTTPRVHRLDYARALHDELVAAGQRQAMGQVQIGTRVRAAKPDASGSTTARGGTPFRFNDERPRALPEKDDPSN